MNEAFQTKANSGHRLLDGLASLRLTVALLVLSMLLVLLGTLEQVHWGVWHVQKEYFTSWYCFYPMDETARARMPLPGGFLLGGLLIANLAFAHFRHFKSGLRNLGISMIHGGLLLLLVGGFVTAVYQEESAMVIPEGESRTYSEAFREFEISLTEKAEAKEKVTVVPDALLRLADPARPESRHIPLASGLALEIKAYHPNASLRALSQMPEGTELKVTQGIGAQSKLALRPLRESFDDNTGNAPAAEVEVIADGRSLGSWILAVGLTESFPPQTFEHAGKTYELNLRRARHYHPFSLRLDQFTHEKYPGTNTPKRFASDVTVQEDGRSFAFNISMNNPLRHGGLTFFQSSFGNTREGKNISVLQVVRNPGAWMPYVSVGLMSVGLLWHFGFSLAKFLRGRGAKVAACALLTLGLASADAAEWDTRELGEIPVQSGGRIIPLETLASGSLLQMRSRREIRLTKLEQVAFGQRPSTWTAEQKTEIARELPGLTPAVQAALEKRPVRVRGGAIGAIDWMLEVSFRGHVARHLPTFRIEHPVVLKMVGRDAEKTLYASWDDILKNSAKVTEASSKARSRSQADRDAEDRALVQLEGAVRQYATLTMTFVPGDLPPEISPQREYEAWLNSLSRAVAEMSASRAKDPQSNAFDPELQKTVRTFVERYQDFQREGTVGLIPPKDAGSLDRWDNLGAALLGVIQDRGAHRPALAEGGVLVRYAKLCEAWREGQDDECSVQSRALAASLRGPWSDKSDSEAAFGRLQPFYWLLIAYVVTVLMVLGSWATGSEGLRRWAYALLITCFVLHTLALGYRMWLHGRPPVTNLYSSGIFVAWGAVGLGIVLERFWKNGIGAAATGITGFVSLIVAHNLGLSGEDNLESVRAVLDSNFWLATHVTIVTLGYSATFVAGLLGAMHLILRVSKPDYAWGDSVARAAYGILAFATLASFIGTMLGGIWADQSWGRFWGWDPKENGAILIVLWCATCLHARWGGLVRREGLMQMLVFGNIVTSWSWFGTNLLGVGLHSYGFTESGFFWLTLFWASQLLVLAMGWLPARRNHSPAT